MNATAIPTVFFEAIPEKLKNWDQWICWRAVPSTKRPGKTDKLPCSPVDGRVIDHLDPSMWLDFLTTREYFITHQGQVSGVGFVLTSRTNLVGIDLDNCFDDAGNLAQWATDIVNRLNSYTEVSPSGKGLRIFILGTLPPGGRRKGAVEMYIDGRFLTVTGNHLPGTPSTVEDRAAEILVVHEEIFGKPPPPSAQPAPSGAPLTLTDQELIVKAMNANGTGATFTRLWQGDLSSHGGDHSAADQALVNMLAYWTRCDSHRMDVLFRASGLCQTEERRRKWDRVGQGTIDKAISTCANVYDPHYRTPEDEDAIRAAQPAVGIPPHVNGNGAGVHGNGAGPGATSAASAANSATSNTSTSNGSAQTAAGTSGQSTGSQGSAPKVSATWTDYVTAAQALGFSFRLNDLNDGLEVNGQAMSDATEAIILSKIHAQNLKSADVARRAFLAAAADDRYHPVKEYLEGLIWDGVDHVSHLAGYITDRHAPIVYADGTQRSVFHAFLRRWLVGAVAKVYDSSAAQNPMLTLAGDQEKGKSYFAKWLCPLPELHFEGAIKPEDKDYLGYLTTRWIWEVSELGATIRKADREALKAFITLQDATYRPAYGRHSIRKPALASFIGTVNFDGALLSDPTGHRRFWPVTIDSIDWGYSHAVSVHQLWAQAYALYQAGEPWQLSKEEKVAHAQIVEFYEVEDILAGYVQEYFVVDPANTTIFTHTTDIISELQDPNGANLKGSARALSMQLSSTLNRLGLTREKRRASGNAPRWGYVGIIKR